VTATAHWDQLAATQPTSWLAAGWSERGQKLRFHHVLDRLQPRRGDSILDYGCGAGGLRAYLDYGVNYIGYDPNPGVITAARERDPDGEYTATRPAGTFDLICAIGVWNLKADLEKTAALAELGWLWARTHVALTVSLYHGTDPACHRYEPCELVDTIERLGPSRWTLERHLDNDLLLTIRK
jgi:SAM-dependent methyltransferase